MTMVNIYEAKSQLSRLIDEAVSGEDVIIARNGRPVARLTRLEDNRPKVRFGVLKGLIEVGDDFDAPLPDEILDAFEGG
jgi:prevent-host-death family protein